MIAEEKAEQEFNLLELRSTWNDWGGMSTTSGSNVTPETAMLVSAFCACVRVISTNSQILGRRRWNFANR